MINVLQKFPIPPNAFTFHRMWRHSIGGLRSQSPDQYQSSWGQPLWIICIVIYYNSGRRRPIRQSDYCKPSIKRCCHRNVMAQRFPSFYSVLIVNPLTYKSHRSRLQHSTRQLWIWRTCSAGCCWILEAAHRTSLTTRRSVHLWSCCRRKEWQGRNTPRCQRTWNRASRTETGVMAPVKTQSAQDGNKLQCKKITAYKYYSISQPRWHLLNAALFYNPTLTKR